MEEQKIKGYRELTEIEIGLINDVKRAGEKLDLLIKAIDEYLDKQQSEVFDVKEADRLYDTQPGRWLAMAKTDLQVGLMKLTRAIAQPTNF